jgi:hypothetical protein
MKSLLVAILVAAVAWFYLIDGSKLDEAMVHEFYEQQSHHTYARDPQALCDQMGRNVSVKITGHLGGQTTTASYNKAAACLLIKNQFKFFEEMGEKAGGILTIEYSYEINHLELASNRKSAAVQVTSTLKMGEEFMQLYSDSTERLERSLRKVQLVNADAQVRMRWTPGAIVHPERYFQAQ